MSGKYGVGAFVRIGSDASISPFRAYIKYSPLPQMSNKPAPAPAGVMMANSAVSGNATASIDDLPESMDVAIYRDGHLQCANTYPFDRVEDAGYYALNAWRTHGLDQLTDELQLMGDGAKRGEITPMLREYVKYVMPAVYPAAAMQLGRNAMQAPLELILLALCE